MGTGVTLVVCSKNRPARIGPCLASIFAAQTLPDETIVVDQSSSPYDLSLFPGVVHVYEPALAGLTSARNVGIRRATGDYVVFVDDDCIFVSDALGAILAAFAAHPDAVAIQPAIVDASGADHTAGGRLIEKIFARGFFDSHSVRLRGDGDRLLRLSGSSMAFRRSLFANELFDEALTGYAYGEDWEFSKRAARWGALYLAPAARIRHDAASENRLSTRGELVVRWNNFRYIYRKLGTRTSFADRLWFGWWIVGETVQWLRLGYGFPRSGS